MKRTRVHCYFLVIGSVIYLIALAAEGDVNGSGDRTLLEIWALKRMLWVTAFYLVFAAVVIAHGLPGLRLPSITDDESGNDQH